MALTVSGNDDKALREMLHNDFMIEEAAGLPYSGIYHGLEGWRELARAVVGTWSRFKVEPIEYPCESEDRFVVRFSISGRSRKTGKSFESTVLELWHFDDARLIQIFPYYFDTHLLAEANRE